MAHERQQEISLSQVTVNSYRTYPDTVDIADSEGDLPPQFLLVELHLDNLEGEPLVEQPVDLGAAGQLVGVDLRRAGALDRTLEVRLQLLDHPARVGRLLFMATVIFLYFI